MKAMIFAVIGMIFWGVAPLFGKLGLRGVDARTALYVRTLVAAQLVLAWMIVRGGGLSPVLRVPARAWLWITLEAICATLLGDLAYYGALKYGQTGPVYLVLSAAPILTIILAALFLKERMTLIQVAGAGLIVLGIWLLVGSSLRFTAFSSSRSPIFVAFKLPAFLLRFLPHSS